MTDEPTLFERMELEARRASRLWWLVAAALAWIVLELTAEPAWAALIACAKVGWPDLRCAWWLRRRDPNPIRGSTLFWCYAGRGLMWISGVAALSSIVLGIALAVVDARGGPIAVLQGPLLVTCWLAGVALSLACLVAMIGIWKAMRHRVRVWIHSQGYAACRHDHWPPPFDPKPNQTGTLEWALFAVIFSVGMVGVWVMCTVSEKLPQPPGAVFAVVIIGSMVTMGLAVVLSRDWLRRRVVARQPYECWPEMLAGHLRQLGHPGAQNRMPFGT